MSSAVFQRVLLLAEDHEDDFENDDEDDSGDSDDYGVDEETSLPQKKAFRYGGSNEMLHWTHIKNILERTSGNVFFGV